MQSNTTPCKSMGYWLPRGVVPCGSHPILSGVLPFPGWCNHTTAAEARRRSQHVTAGCIRLGVLAQVLAQCLNPLALDPDE